MNKKLVIELGMGVGILAVIFSYLKWEQKNFDAQRSLVKKNEYLFNLMEQWVLAKQEGKDFGEYFKRNNYKTVAVYGMGVVGRRLIRELKDSGIEVSYGIDRNAKKIFSDVSLFTLDDKLPKADVVVVTIGYDYEPIGKELINKGLHSVTSIDDVLFSVLNIECT